MGAADGDMAVVRQGEAELSQEELAQAPEFVAEGEQSTERAAE